MRTLTVRVEGETAREQLEQAWIDWWEREGEDRWMRQILHLFESCSPTRRA